MRLCVCFYTCTYFIYHFSFPSVFCCGRFFPLFSAVWPSSPFTHYAKQQKGYYKCFGTGSIGAHCESFQHSHACYACVFLLIECKLFVQGAAGESAQLREEKTSADVLPGKVTAIRAAWKIVVSRGRLSECDWGSKREGRVRRLGRSGGA